ncbi:MAG: hypothetical protein AAB659_02050, partial [Patescibacteria group bacterium]
MLPDSSTILNAQVEAIDADQSMVKIYIVVVGGVLLSTLTSYLFANGYLLLGLISMIFLSVMLVLQNFFVKGFDKLFVAACLESVAGAGFFYADFSGMLVAVITVLVAVLVKSFFDVRRELETSIKVRFWKICKVSLSSNVPALMLFFLALLSVNGSFFTETNFTNFILKPTSPIIAAYLRDFDPSKNTKEFITEMLVSNFSETDKQELGKLTPAAKNQAITSLINKFSTSIEISTGSTIDLNKPISTNIYNGIMAAYNRLAGNSL